jgi:regulator of sirC expression with transglutaminase-like and TPR domain
MKKRIEALMSLLDDPDEDVFNSVLQGFVKDKAEVVYLLENKWEKSQDLLIQRRIEQVLDAIRLDDAIHQLQEWLRLENPRLLELLFILNRFQYPGIPEERYRSKLERIVREAFQASRLALTELAKVKVINHLLFDVYRLTPVSDVSNPNPSLSFVHSILENGKASPMGLLCLYLALSEQIGLNLEPVPLPRHFILSCCSGSEQSNLFNPNTGKILFYLNPFGQGATFSVREVEHFLKQNQVALSEQYTQNVSKIEFVLALLNYYSEQYRALNHVSRSAAYITLREIVLQEQNNRQK